MSLNWPRNDHNNVQEYQLSGIPYVSSSAAGGVNDVVGTLRFSFPFVSRWVMLCQFGVVGTAPIKVGFTSGSVNPPGSWTDDTGNNKNWIDVYSGGSMFGPYEVKCTDVWVTGGGFGGTNTVHLIAGLTTVPSDPLRQLLTGSNEFEGIG